MPVFDDLTARLRRLRAIENDPPRRLRRALPQRQTDIDGRERFLVFGADVHRYRNTPLTRDAVAAFEGALGVSLPPAYREFLLRVGPGAGPYYGIFTPQESLDEFELVGDPAGEFRFTRADVERLYGRRRAWLRDPDSTGGPAADSLVPEDGCIPIGTQGCEGLVVLVVTGDLAGTIWDWGSTSIRPATAAPATLIKDLYAQVEPIFLGPTPDFLAWYDAWLVNAWSQLAGGDAR
ncbi:SMI1/KNR4 family protein [Actinomadura sp. 7K507]|uniref:SMI1/KNR4 family protein n=1 Tax=Actinomadura sp. 7K507 TaxID=2530365 RepID=UPI0014052210|nr:SMI1/KNR4 family protein [Actinomadura sp. 7K507]